MECLQADFHLIAKLVKLSRKSPRPHLLPTTMPEITVCVPPALEVASSFARLKNRRFFHIREVIPEKKKEKSWPIMGLEWPSFHFSSLGQ